MLSITLLTHNNEKRIGDVLESLTWADEVILLDTGSTDHTVEIARTFPNVKIHTSQPGKPSQLRKEADALATYDWIFSLESDEMVSAELALALQELTKDPACVYSMPRRNFFNEKWIKTCGWHPDRQTRLYHRKRIREQAQVVKLSDPILHYPFTSIADLLDKLQEDSDRFAAQYQSRKKASLLRAHFGNFWAFWKSYLFKRGFLSGAEGYIISRYLGHLAFYRSLKLRQLNLNIPPMRQAPSYDEDV